MEDKHWFWLVLSLLLLGTIAIFVWTPMGSMMIHFLVGVLPGTLALLGFVGAFVAVYVVPGVLASFIGWSLSAWVESIWILSGESYLHWQILAAALAAFIYGFLAMLYTNFLGTLLIPGLLAVTGSTGAWVLAGIILFVAALFYTTVIRD